MTQVNMHESKSRLSELAEAVGSGREALTEPRRLLTADRRLAAYGSIVLPV